MAELKTPPTPAYRTSVHQTPAHRTPVPQAPDRPLDDALPWYSGRFGQLSNWFFGAFGAFGVVLAIGFYFSGQEKRDLVYMVSPSRAVVVDRSVASRLSVAFDGLPVTTDITAAQVAIWNVGKRSIHTSEVLRPVYIEIEGSLPILEATIRQTSRDVTDVRLDTSKLSVGQVGVEWKILEHNDGASLQIVYAGSPGAQFHVAGNIEGQGVIRQNKPFDKIPIPRAVLILIMVGNGIVNVIVNTFFSFKVKKNVSVRASVVALLIMGIVFAICAIVYLQFFADNLPPFPF